MIQEMATTDHVLSTTGLPDSDKSTPSKLTGDSLERGMIRGITPCRSKESLLSLLSPLLVGTLEEKDRLFAHSLASELSELYYRHKRAEESLSYQKSLLREENLVNITLFKTGTAGSEVVYSDELAFTGNENAQEVLLGKLGTYYIFGLGQGNTPSFGLYELPVAEYAGMSALVYAFKSTDSANQDERMHCQEYCILTIFYPKRFGQVFSDRHGIKKYLDSKVKQVNKLSSIDGAFFSRLKLELLDDS
ncbi:MAG: hypothetical protein ACFFD4_17065 [Candidatus Odinarchaeota archaeon]